MDKKISFIFVFALILSVILLGVVKASSENYIAQCDLVEGQGENEYDYVIVIRELLRSDMTKSEARSNIYEKNILPGNYEVTLVASDGYDSRVNVTQNYEQYYASFRKNSSEVAKSNAHEDLEDNVSQVVLKEIVNDELELPNGADEVKAFHYKYNKVPTTDSPNSVAVVCIGLKKIVEPKCGDGKVNQESEECDDGNNVSGDGCSAECEIETPLPFCGNGKIEFPETCDRGALNGFLCWAGYGSSCSYCSRTCQNITITNYCGDGIKQECEECDDGNNVSGDGCYECKIENPSEPFCGNEIVEAGEECDDGNTQNNDGCSAECEIEENPTCEYDVSIKKDSPTLNYSGTGIGIKPTSGDWISGNPAEIEKGNYLVGFYIENNKNISDEVQIFVKIDNTIIAEYNRTINPSSHINNYSVKLNVNNAEFCGAHTIYLEVENEDECNTSDNYAERQIFVHCTCGDGELEADEGEECDDGNLVNGDGCSSTCQIEEEEDDDVTLLSYSGKKLDFHECIPNWECSGWSECSYGVKTRNCVDEFNCEVEYNKPIESTKCVEPIIANSKTESGLNWFFIFGVILLIILLIILINLLR